MKFSIIVLFVGLFAIGINAVSLPEDVAAEIEIEKRGAGCVCAFLSLYLLRWFFQIPLPLLFLHYCSWPIHYRGVFMRTNVV